MKKVVAGGFLSLIGTIWSLAIMVYVGNDLVSSWSTPPGRFLTTAAERDMVFPLILSVGLVLIGILMMLIECFRKEN